MLYYFSKENKQNITGVYCIALKEKAMRGKGLLLGLSSLGLLFAAGFKPTESIVRAEEVASSMPANWSLSILDDSNNPITSDYLTASAYKDSNKGNSLMMSRRISAYALSVTSAAFEASKDTAYKLTFFYRSNCLHDEENKIVASIIENKDDGSKTVTEIVSAKGRESNWKQLSGYYTASSGCSTLEMTFSCYGMGDFYINGPSLVGKPAPTTYFANYGMENGPEDKTPLTPLLASNLSDDACSGERSIKLTDQGFKTNFGELPAGDYELKFKYKHDFEDGSRLSIRMDNVSSDGTTRGWYTKPVGPNGTGGNWSTYSYKFKKLNEGEANFCPINYIKIHAYGTFLIDDLEIINSSNFNYIAGGSFEGYDVSNIFMSGAVGISKDGDGSLVFAGSYDSVLGISSEPSLTLESSKFELTTGNTYTLKYKYRGGYYETGSAYYGTTKIYTGTTSDDWSDVSVDFVAAEATNIKLLFCASSPRTAYIKNISITDTENIEKLPEVIKEYNSTEGEAVESFPYGDFEYDFPPTPIDSSSSSSTEETSFTQETKPSEEPSSKPDISSSEQSGSYGSSSSNQDSSSEGETHPSNQKSTSTAALTGTTIAMLTVSTIGLAVAIYALIRGKKNG